MSKSLERIIHALQRTAGRGGFARSVAQLSGGMSVGLAISLVLSPAITRLYSPGSIGQLALFTSFVNVATVTVSLCYELGVVSARDEREASQLVGLAALFSVPMSLFFTAVLYVLMRFAILGFGALPRYTPLLMLPVLLLTGAFGTLRYWEIRRQGFGTLSRVAVSQHTARSVSQVVAGLIQGSPVGLFCGELLGRGAGMSAMFREALPALKQHIRDSRPSEYREALCRHRKFPLFSLPSGLIDALSVNLSVPLLVYIFGSDVGGHFALVQKVMAVPLYLVAGTVADVFHSRFATYAQTQPEACAPLFWRTALVLVSVGLVPAVALIAYGKPLFALVFGSRWVLAGAMAGAMVPWFLLQFVVSPLSRLVLVLRRQEFKLMYDLVALSSLVMVFWGVKHYALSVLQTIRWLAGVNTVAYLIYFLVLMFLLNRAPHGTLSKDPARFGLVARVAFRCRRK